VERGEKEPYHLRQFPPIIRRYFVGYFGEKLKKKSMSAITGDDIEAYWRWRYDYWTKGPGRNQPFIRYEREVMKDAGPSKISIRRPVKETAPSRSTLNKEKMLLQAAMGVCAGAQIRPGNPTHQAAEVQEAHGHRQARLHLEGVPAPAGCQREAHRRG
jgi:hypothetical protein